MIAAIYKIEHIASGRKYIGSSKDAATRMRKHREKLNRNEHENMALQNAWNKHGVENFRFSIIMVCSEMDLIFYEQKVIDVYKSSTKPYGYNIRKRAESNIGIPSGRLTHKSGDRHGRRVLIKQIKVGSNDWLVECDCGKQNIVDVKSLSNAGVKSCGCYRKEKLSKLKTTHHAGDKFGRLTLVSLHKRNHNKGSAAHFWLCKCDCGKNHVANVTAVKRGDIKSCGCLRIELLKARNSPRL